MPRLRQFLPALLAALLGAASASAHNAPGSSVQLDFFRDHLRAELRLPLSELELSFAQPLLIATAVDHAGLAPGVNFPAAEILARIDRHRSALGAYVLSHVTPRAPDGRSWAVAVTDLSVALGEEPVDLVVHLRLAPPPGAPLRRFTLHYDVISHEVINHFAFVFVRRDWNHAVFPDHPELLDSLRHFNPALAVDRTGGSLWLGLRHRVIAALGHFSPLVATPLVAAFLVTVWLTALRRARRACGVRWATLALAVLLLALPMTVRAHRLDECLQCSFVSVARSLRPAHFLRNPSRNPSRPLALPFQPS